MKYTRIVGTGRYLPEKILTNADLEKIVDTTDEWIRTRTGVERRHCTAENETTSDMCFEAAKVAIEDAGISVEDIDLVIIGTTSPDLVFPNVATLVQHRLGIPACAAFSLEAACTGFIYALTTADKFLKTGQADEASDYQGEAGTFEAGNSGEASAEDSGGRTKTPMLRGDDSSARSRFERTMAPDRHDSGANVPSTYAGVTHRQSDAGRIQSLCIRPASPLFLFSQCKPASFFTNRNF